MKRFAVLVGVVSAIGLSAVGAKAAPILISGLLPNPNGTDTPNEYIQLKAAQSIDFSVTNYTIIAAINGTVTSAGWVAGTTHTFAFQITSGTVNPGDVFYVGGSGKLINGAGSTDISGATWLRSINTTTTGGDGGLGSNSATEVIGNGGSSADGIGIFAGLVSGLTSASVPLDAVFYGTAIGNARSGANGYVLPVNDLYNGGLLGDIGSTTLMNDPAGSQFLRLTGTYSTTSGSWTTARVGSLVTLTATSQLADISSAITLVPEPASLSLLAMGALALLGRRRR